MARGPRVVYRDRDLEEWFAAGPLGIEQGFTVSRRPAGGREALTVALRPGGSLRAVRVGSEVRFVTRRGHVGLRYGALSAVDATGARLPAKLMLAGRRLLLRIDDRRAHYPVRIDPFIQAGAKLTGTAESGAGAFGYSVAVSADGSTAMVGGYDDNGGVGAVWVFTQSGGVWTQQGSKLVGDCQGNGSICAHQGTGEVGNGFFGLSVALSSDGNTALIGAGNDGNFAGAAWVFTRSGSTWSQQGAKLVGDCTAAPCTGPNGTGETGIGAFGVSVALSPDGTTALIGGNGDSSAVGAAWVFTRSGTAWSQQGAKLVGDCTAAPCTGPSGTGEIGAGQFGGSVDLSADGSTALIGAPNDNSNEGAAWVFTRVGSAWSQQAELVGDCTSSCGGPDGTGELSTGEFGFSVSLSADGDTALIGAVLDGGSDRGAAWVFTRAGTAWGQQGAKLVGDCTAGPCTGPNGTGESGSGFLGGSVGLSADGNTALIGAAQDASAAGAAWVFTRSGSTWSQQGAKLIGDCASSCTGPNGTGESGSGQFGSSVALSGDASAALIGAVADNSGVGAAWAFAAQSASATPTTTSLGSSQNPSTIGQQVTFTATIAPTPDGGSVNFTYNGATLCQAVAVAAGQATCQTSFAAHGSYSVLATYLGDANYQSSSSSTLTQTVGGTATTTTLRSRYNPSEFGVTNQYTAAVSPVPDGGTVAFTDGGTAIPGCAALSLAETGRADCFAPAGALGNHSIVATYSGDSTYDPSASAALSEIVRPVTTTVTLTSSPDPSGPGHKVTYTATVSPLPEGGTVNIAEVGTGDFICRDAPLSASGQASCATIYTHSGSHSIVAVYQGDANYQQSFSNVLTQVVANCAAVAQGVYVTQGTQPDTGGLVPSGRNQSGQPYQGVTLVAGKKTVVRLYANAAGSSSGLHGVAARLYGYKSDGRPLPGRPLAPDYGPSTLPDLGAGTVDEIVSDKELLSDANAYTFTLPRSWNSDAGSSTVKLKGTVQVGGPHSICQSSNNFTLTRVKFTEVGASYYSAVTPVPMTVNGKLPPAPSQVLKDSSAVTPLTDGALGFRPYDASVDITDIATSCHRHGHTAAAECADQQDYALSRLEKLYPATHQHLFGVTLQNYGVTNASPGNYTVDGQDFNDAHRDGGSFPGSNDRPLTGVAHELFHQFGLVHASNECGGGQDNDKDDSGQTGEPWAPDQQGYLDGIGLDPTSEPYQFIANGATQTLNGTSYTLAPGQNQSFDFMSYCSTAGIGDPGDWISPKNWQQLVSNFGTAHAAADAASASAGTGGRGPLAPDAQVDPARLSVLGFVTRAGVSVTNVGPQVGPPSPNGNSADSFTLTARGSSGQVLTSVPMAATTGGHTDPVATTGRQLNPSTASPLVQISGEIPAAGVDSLQVSNNGSVVATRTRPANAPHVRVLSPRAGARIGTGRTVRVRWKATNPEHQELSATIDYSRDGGRTWRTIFVGPNTGRASLESFFLTASQHARVRVRVNDGFNESDALSGRFVAQGAPPQVTIANAFAKRMRVAGDAQVQLSGGAVDQAGQTLSGRRLRWFDGPFPLGRGNDISAGPLPSGVNHLRLVARDPSGRTATATLTVKVAPVMLPFLKLAIPRSANPGARALTFRGSAAIPTTLTIGRQRFRLGKKTRRIRLAIAPGRGPLLLEMSVTANSIGTPFAARVTR